MAYENVTRNERANGFVGMPTDYLLDLAEEAVEGLVKENGHQYCLASVITESLTPSEGEDEREPLALGIAEVLENLLIDTGQIQQLRLIVEALKAGAGEKRS